MKKIVLPIVIIFFSLQSFSQQTFLVTKGTAIKAVEDVKIVFNNTDLKNNSTIGISKDEAAIRFEGDIDNNISGNGSTTLDRVVVDKELSAKVKLKNDLTINTSVTFKNGLLDGGNNILNLGTTGTLINESERSRATAGGNGYIKAISTIPAAAIVNPGNLGAVITTSVDLGSTVIKRGSTSFNNGKDNSASRYYEIIPQNNSDLNAQIAFKYFDAELNGNNEKEISIYKSAGNNWTSEGSEMRDYTQNYVVKKGINSFSKYTLFPAPEEITVYPNPVADIANTSVVSKTSAIATLEIYDAKGSVVKSVRQSINEGVNNLAIEMRELAGGAYTLHAKWANTEKVIKLIKE